MEKKEKKIKRLKKSNVSRPSKKIKLCLVSSSGGHYEQLRQLKPLLKKYNGFWVTEQTLFEADADYFLPSTGSNDKAVLWKMAVMCIKALGIWIKERPDVVITTGALIAVPFALLAKITRKKLIYIETYARVTDGSRAGKWGYKMADLFIYQWETLESIYPNGVYGGSIY